MTAVIDTNVILDAIADRVPWNKEVQEIFIKAANCEFDAFITANATTDIYYLVHKHLNNQVQTKEIRQKLLSLFSVLDVSASDCINALCSEITDYEDAVIEACGVRHNIDYIVTRNVKDFKQSALSVKQPEHFLKLFGLT